MLGIIDIVALVVEVAGKFMGLAGIVRKISERLDDRRFKEFLGPGAAGGPDNRKVLSQMTSLVKSKKGRIELALGQVSTGTKNGK